MQSDIHPKNHQIEIQCTCGNKMAIASTLAKGFNVEICSACHPFYTGKQKIIDTGGRVARFSRRYQKKS
ncbi:MAG: 50S ribosomal protein L31 [Gammaproteobacteria bacterium]